MPHNLRYRARWCVRALRWLGRPDLALLMLGLSQWARSEFALEMLTYTSWAAAHLLLHLMYHYMLNLLPLARWELTTSCSNNPVVACLARGARTRLVRAR